MKHKDRPANRETQFQLRLQWKGPFQVLEVIYTDDWGAMRLHRINWSDDWGPYNHAIPQDKLKPYATTQADWPLREKTPPLIPNWSGALPNV